MATKVLHNQFEINDVHFRAVTAPVQGSGQLPKLPLYYGPSSGSVVIQTPPMTVPFGISESKLNKGQLTMKLSFPQSGSAFESKLVALDELVQKAAEAHIQQLFPKIKEALRNTMYTPIVSASEKYAPTVRVKLLVDREGKLETKLRGPDNSPIDWTAVTPRSVGRAVLRVSNIWAAQNKTYGASLFVETLKIDSFGGSAAKDDTLLEDDEFPLPSAMVTGYPAIKTNGAAANMDLEEDPEFV